MIHSSKIHELVETIKIFSIGWVSESGEKIHVRKCTCTSFHSSGDTLNILIIDSGQIRKIRRVTITEFNGEEVVI
ncbi:MAG: hypothetical protein M0R37_03920 [Bacteroidales bacterium]|nr:hypothetical protein [Bacteroidales bacterium]